MKNFKEVFESIYGDGSFNDEFLITALSAENIHLKTLPSTEDMNGKAIKLFLIAKSGSLEDFIKSYKLLHFNLP